MALVPYVVEQTSRGERSYDIYSRLLEQGFCGTALYDGADGQPALRLERPNPA